MKVAYATLNVNGKDLVLNLDNLKILVSSSKLKFVQKFKRFDETEKVKGIGTSKTEAYPDYVRILIAKNALNNLVGHIKQNGYAIIAEGGGIINTCLCKRY